MTVSELYLSVAQLGFEESLEYESGFIFAANRALLQVNALRPATSACIVNHRVLENMIAKETFNPVEKTEDLIFEAVGVKSYYFEADGTGTAFIEIQEPAGTWRIIGTVAISANRSFAPYRGFIKDGGNFVGSDDVIRIRFSGDFIYFVKCVAMYKHLYSAQAADIPAYEQYVRYDISAMVHDFLSLCDPPIKTSDDEPERLNQGYDVENGRIILLPRDNPGIFKILYNRKPALIENHGEPEDDETIIDLDEELCALLPPLVASYVWVDDEPEKAQYYLAIYRERAVDIERRVINAAPVAIKNRSGW